MPKSLDEIFAPGSGSTGGKKKSLDEIFGGAKPAAPAPLYQKGITANDLGADLKKGVLGPIIQRSQDISASQGNGPLPAVDKGVSQTRNVVQAANQPFNAAFKATGLPWLADKLGSLVAKGSELLGRADASIFKAVLPKKAEEKLASGLTTLADPASNVNESFRSYVNQTFDPATKNALGLVSDVAELAGNVVGAKEFSAATPGVLADAEGAATSKILAPLRDRAVTSLEADYSKWTGQTKTGVKNLGKTDAKVAKMNAAGTTGQTPQRILAEAHIIPETEGTKFRTADQAKTYRDSLEPLHQAERKAIEHIEPITQPVRLDDFERRAIEKVRTPDNVANGKANKLEAEIRREFADYRSNYGDEVKLMAVEDIKSARYKDMRFDFTQPLKADTNGAIARSAREIIEETANKAGFTDLAQLNREIGSRLDAADFLEKLDGQTLKYGKLGKYAFMGIGASLGSTVAGKVLGVLGGDLLAQLLMSTDVAGPVKRMVLSSLAETSPEAYQATLKWIKENNIAIESRVKEGLLLKPGNPSASNSVPIPLGPKYSTDPNHGAVLSSSQEAAQNMGLPAFHKTTKLPTIVIKPKGKALNLKIKGRR
jgi:hypothetical protein